ncbi:MAG: hypothetical protein IJ426_01950 [Clostridia bacterium]|nr:hypothetical protein [Clostridia bacterium]
MKKAFTVVLLLALSLSLFSCDFFSASSDEVAKTLGKYEKRELYVSDGFQDYTVYGKYFYKESNVEVNELFEQINDQNYEELIGYLDNFCRWLDDADEVLEHYDFDRSVITNDDFLYIDNRSKEGFGKYNTYDVYLYDTQTDILYLFHNNI